MSLNSSRTSMPDPSLGDARHVTLQTRTGLCLCLRPVTVDDGPMLSEFFRNLTPEDLRFRFLSGQRDAKPHQIAQMISVDHRRTEHLVAFAGDEGPLAASLMIAADEALKEAEVAISIARPYRDQGAGWTLLRHAADLARERGVKRLKSIESRDNQAAIEVERTLGFKTSAYDGDETLVLVETELK